jgi:hypothetical protein
MLDKTKPNGDTALEYLKANPDCHIFPITPLAKYPPCFSDNLKRASNDPAQIKKWAARFPGCNWGLACAKSNRIVVDVDTKPGKVGRDTFHALAVKHKAQGGFAKTFTASTPTGGTHLYYKCEPGQHVNALGKSGFGPDVDSTNYVLLPGCKLADGTGYAVKYQAAVADAPEWFFEYLKKREKSEHAPDAAPVVDLDTPGHIEWAIHFLKNDAPPAIEGRGGEATTLQVAGVLKDYGISRDMAKMLMAEHYNVPGTCDPEWSGTDLDKKVDNAFDYLAETAPGQATAEAQFPPLTAEETADIAATIIKDAGVTAEEITAQRTELKPPPMTPQRLAKEWVWVAGQKRFIRCRDGWRIDREGFDSLYNYLCKPSISRALFSRRLSIKRLENMVFRPGNPEITGSDYNLWRPSAIVPKEGDTKFWNEHLEYLFPNKRDRDHVLNWMAWVYRNQSLKPNHALLIVGEEHGAGKSIIARIFEQLIGVPNTQRPKNSSLKGDFNAWAVQCKLAIIEELMQIGRREVANELRNIITEPFVEVNIKNVSAYLIENYMAMIAISNHVDALPLEESDRRWLVVRTDAEKQPFEFYNPIFSVLRSPDALAALAYELQHRDTGTYDGRGEAPITEAKAEMQGYATGGLLTWLRDNADTFPPIVNIKTDILGTADAAEYVKEAGGPTKAEKIVAAFLRKSLKGVPLGNHSFGRQHRLRLWAINGHATRLQAMTAETRVREYQAQRDTATAEIAAEAGAQAAEDFGAGGDDDIDVRLGLT